MYVREIASLFRKLVDEQDTSWLTASDVALYLKQGYEEFRRHVTASDRAIYEQHATLAVPSPTQMVPLSTGTVKLLGSSVSAGKQRLIRLFEVFPSDANGIPTGSYTAARTGKEVLGFTPSTASPLYYLTGVDLMFSVPISGYITLSYYGESLVDWTKQASGDNEWVDDLTPFHDLIAMYAAKLYSARDGGQNPMLQSLTADRTRQLIDFVQTSRSTEAFDSVYVEY